MSDPPAQANACALHSGRSAYQSEKDCWRSANGQHASPWCSAFPCRLSTSTNSFTVQASGSTSLRSSGPSAVVQRHVGHEMRKHLRLPKPGAPHGAAQRPLKRPQGLHAAPPPGQLDRAADAIDAAPARPQPVQPHIERGMLHRTARRHGEADGRLRNRFKKVPTRCRVRRRRSAGIGVLVAGSRSRCERCHHNAAACAMCAGGRMKK